MTAPAPVEPTTKPGMPGQLDVLARQLLAQRSGLEAIITAAGDNKAVAGMAHALIDQLEAAFTLVNVMTMTADMIAVAETIETPASDGRPEKPPVFGARRRAAAAAASESNTNTGVTTDG